MKLSTLVALMLIYLVLAGCNKPPEEKVPANDGAGSAVGQTGERKLPECAKRNPDGTYKYGHACTKEQWLEWEKTQAAAK